MPRVPHSEEEGEAGRGSGNLWFVGEWEVVSGRWLVIKSPRKCAYCKHSLPRMHPRGYTPLVRHTKRTGCLQACCTP